MSHRVRTPSPRSPDTPLAAPFSHEVIRAESLEVQDVCNTLRGSLTCYPSLSATVSRRGNA